MAWVKTESRYPRNPKVLKVSRDIRYFNIEAWCWSAEYQTDGYIPEEALGEIGAGISEAAARRYAKQLEEARRTIDGNGLWVRVEGGWRIHEYLERNPTKEQREQEAERKADAGRLGGLKSGEARRKQGASRSGEADAKQTRSTVLPIREAASRTPSPSPSPSPSGSPSPPSPAPGPSGSSPLTPAVSGPSQDGGAEGPPPGVRPKIWERILAECEQLGVDPRPEYADVDLTVRADLLNRKERGDPEVTPAYVRARFTQNLAKQGKDREAVAKAARGPDAP